ncbi:MAG: LysM peptidoglycan-binding domain-containing protein [Parachlamydiales bacterium]|nr:LysM peptidoglycan-binding domain-containing protein [Parachlamydiales bacterium]
MMEASSGRTMRQVRWLTQALIISGAFNIGLLATFFYLLLRQNPSADDFLHKPKAVQKVISLDENHSNAKVLSQLEGLSFDQLLGRLDHTQAVEDGYTIRDLSLACMVHRYQFNLEKALGGQPLQQRVLSWKKESGQLSEVTIFPGLSEENFRQIVHFATTERWPLTSKGLFVQLKRADILQQKSLLEAFFLTPEFLAVETLMSHAGVALNRHRLVALLREGSFSTLSAFTESQKQCQDFSAEKRQEFLLEYAAKKSRAAAYLLLQTDSSSIVKRANDEQILTLLDLFEEQTPEVEQFAIELLASPRSDAVWKKAASRLYAFHQEALPEPYDHRAAMVRFVPKAILQEKIASVNLPKEEPELQKITPPQVVVKQPIIETKEPVKPMISKPAPMRRIERVYIVQDGDNLWKIAHKYSTGIDTLRSYNHLKNDQLKVGQILKIPQDKVN